MNEMAEVKDTDKQLELEHVECDPGMWLDVVDESANKQGNPKSDPEESKM